MTLACHCAIQKYAWNAYNITDLFQLIFKDSLWMSHIFGELHWLPIQAHINFKTCLLMYRVHTNSSPSYVFSLITPCSSLQFRRTLRSLSQADFIITWLLRKFENRAFALAEWNKLPDFICKSGLLSLFKTNLKTYSSFVMTRLSSVTRYCANFILFRCTINDSLIIIIII